MTFDEKTLRSVIAEVISEMAGSQAAAPAAQAPAPVTPVSGKMVLTEQGDAPKGVAPDEVVIGLAPAFGIYQTETIIHQPHDKVLREIIALP